MEKQYLVIELRKPEDFEKLEKEIESLHAEIERLRRDLRACEVKYGYEVTINSELIDLLKAHKISFRQVLDRGKRKG